MGDDTNPNRLSFQTLGGIALAAASVVVLNLLVCLMALYLIHGGASPAPPGPPAGVTVAPAGE